MYIGDLHIHSRYSRATSKECTPEYLDLWARRKGIGIVGTGDFTHPAWREELEEKLEPAEEGLYVLKDEYRIRENGAAGETVPRFVITGEISSIYKKNGKVRKVHSLILLPGLEDAGKIAARLEQIGNIHSDGRPILGLDCRDLLEIILELSPDAVYVPAHIWTPHFSLFGAFSGFDTMEECFEDLTPYIHAVETGLSSDPPMNWRVSALDGYQLISNSDAHSPSRLGREATLFDISLSYPELARAVQTGEGLYGTIEFFPEEGKYHMDGHRKCNLCLTPAETMKYHNVCPVCGRKITIGVSHRIEELADREEHYVSPGAKPFESLVPLPEVIGASEGMSAAGKKVQRQYQNMLEELGPEFEILRNLPLEEIRKTAGSRVAEGIRRLRMGRVERIPGFDGEYGTIRLFSNDELHNTEGQMNFFGLLNLPKDEGRRKAPEKKESGPAAVQEKQPEKRPDRQPVRESWLYGQNEEQEHAVRSISPRIAVKAGPGTGKTKTLVSRIRYLLEYRKVPPSEITAVTFTNQAAAEMRERIGRETGKKQAERLLQIGTFHKICLGFLKEQGEDFSLMGEARQQILAEDALEETGADIRTEDFLRKISYMKSGHQDDKETAEFTKAYERYEQKKAENRLLDFDDLLVRTVKRIEEGAAAPGWEKRFRYLLVDEFQDIDPVQFDLIRLWCRSGRELFVIGDEDQSIYGFRGADSTCFDRLAGEYPDLELIRLKENYRSSPEILTAAQAVIGRGKDDPGFLHANCPPEGPVRLIQAESPMGEAVFIAKEINRMAGGLGMLEAHRASGVRDETKIRSFGEIAVLCRTHRQAELVEKCLRTESIPYVVAGREAFLEEDAVRYSLLVFRAAISETDQESAEKCVRYFWDMDWNPMSEQIWDGTLESLRTVCGKKKPEKILEQWSRERGLSDDPGMQKLCRTAVFFSTMEEFLEGISLGGEADLKRCGTKKYTADSVSILTMHGAKGLEFPVVFLYGAEQGVMPLEQKNHPTDTGEERRLFYVALTRAKEELILTASGEKSAFLETVPENVMSVENAGKKKKEEWHQMSLFE